VCKENRMQRSHPLLIEDKKHHPPDLEDCVLVGGHVEDNREEL